MDDNAVRGRTREEYEEKLRCFLNSAKMCNITFNERKCTYTTDSIKLLGYHISNGVLQQDPDRVKPLRIASADHWQGTPTPCGNVCVLCSVGSLFFRKNKAVDCNETASLA